MTFRITGLSPDPFRPLFGLTNDALAAQGIVRCTAPADSGWPCRVSLQDAAPGETLLLLNYLHQPALSPYRASGPVFIRQAAGTRFDATGTLPPVATPRILSVRAYDSRDHIEDAEVVDGLHLTAEINRMFANPAVRYLHVHYARRGCFAFRVDRA